MKIGLNSLTREETKRLAVVFLLTDGNVIWRRTRNQVQLRFYGNDLALHELFTQTMFRAFKVNPVYFFKQQTRVKMTVVEVSKNSTAINELYTLCPEFRTNKHHVNTPTLKPIIDAQTRLLRLAFRVGMSTEGCISYNGKCARLRLGCAQPILAEEWLQIAHSLGLEMNLSHDKNTWSGVHGITSDKLETAKKFLTLGGFIPGVCAHRSKIFPGREKNQILAQSVAELTARRPT